MVTTFIKKLGTCILSGFCMLWTHAGGYAQEFIFTPQWTPQSQFAGYYAAYEKGFYKEAGVDVVIQHPSASGTAINKLMQGSTHAISSQLVAAMIFVDEGMPLVNVMQTSQNNSLMLVTQLPVDSLEDLRGKKIGRWKAGFYELGQILNNEKDLRIEWIPFLQNVNLFISGAIDATLAMSYNEYFQLLASGIKLSPKNIFRFSDLGYNVPEDGIYVTRSYYNANKERIARFVKASERGWRWVAEHQEEALDIVMKLVKEHKVGTNRTHQQWMLKETLDLQRRKTETDKKGEVAFTLQKCDFQKTFDLLFKHGFILHPITFEQFTGL